MVPAGYIIACFVHDTQENLSENSGHCQWATKWKWNTVVWCDSKLSLNNEDVQTNLAKIKSNLYLHLILDVSLFFWLLLHEDGISIFSLVKLLFLTDCCAGGLVAVSRICFGTVLRLGLRSSSCGRDRDFLPLITAGSLLLSLKKTAGLNWPRGESRAGAAVWPHLPF